MMFFSFFLCSSISCLLSGFDKFSALRISTDVWVITGMENGAQMWSVFLVE